MAFFDRFRHLLLLLDLDADVETTLAVAESLSPAVERVHCLCLPNVQDELDEVEGHSPAAIACLKTALAAWQKRAPQLIVSFAFEAGLHAASIAHTAEELAADLVVVAPLRAHSARDRASLLLRLAAQPDRHVLSVGTGLATAQARHVGRGRVLLALDADAASVPALCGFVAGLGDKVEVSAFVPSASDVRVRELAAMFAAHEPGHSVPVHALNTLTTNLAEAMDVAARGASADLIIGAADAVSSLEALAFGFFSGAALQRATCPVLVLPRTQAAPLYLRERLVASDALFARGHPARLAVEREGAFGRIALSPLEKLVVIEHGEEHPPLPQDDGILSLPSAFIEDAAHEHALLIETRTAGRESAAARVFCSVQPVILLDAAIHTLPPASLSSPARNHSFVFVRMRRSDGLEQLRERLSVYREVIGTPLVVDASAWLDDGGAEDVPSLVDGQRLLRVGLRMMASGIAVRAVVTKEQHLRTRACHVLMAKEWESFDFEKNTAYKAPPSPPNSDLHRELDLCTNSQQTAGHEVHIDIDNAAARKSVLRLIANAKERIHWQCYIVEDDATTAEFAEALAQAAARGVTVRFLADAVYSLHDAFGQKNSFLAHIAANPGVSVLAFRPVAGMPNLSALKRRNHRKCIVIDGQRAVITGRNLGEAYYRGFHEVQLGPLSPYREVPWLDCGARFEGPLVEALEHSFAREWSRAGGDAYPILSTPHAGPLHARLVLHDGLRDTHTFDAQLALIRHAKRELVVVNNFPLVLELQRALLSAVARGVRVRVLFGSVRPHFGNEVPFPGGALRTIADQLVRARLDAVVTAGGEVYEYALDALPEWDPLLVRVFPHVHAKLLMRDGIDTALGSANLDVTAAYWENEAMLIVHDEHFASTVAHALKPLFESARRVDPESDAFRAEASQRAWLSRYWPSLLG